MHINRHQMKFACLGKHIDAQHGVVLGAGELLKELLNPEKHPEITVETRRDVKWVLRHYPDRQVINAMASHCPDYLERLIDEVPKKVPLPDGHDNWLDYAVATMDTRSVQVEQMFSETGEWTSREAIIEAARAELVALRDQKSEKLTVDQMIARLAPDRQAAVLAMAEKMTQARNDARSAETNNPLTTASHSPSDSSSQSTAI